MSDMHMARSVESVNDTINHAVQGSRELPQFDDVLNDIAPHPYTLNTFKSYLEKNHCSEFLDFIIDLREYSERYKSANCRIERSTPQCDESKYLVGLWRRLVSIYIVPGSSREMNLSSEEREQLLQYMDDMIPPPPSFIEDVVKRVYDTFQSSVFVLFLSSSSPSTTVDWADAIPTKAESGTSTPFSADYPLTLVPDDGFLDQSNQNCADSSDDAASQMSSNRTEKTTSLTHLLAVFNLKSIFKPNRQARKKWKSGMKLAVQRVPRY
ncbi:RGS domain-containing protein [Aspergillus ambiguus]|uniref:regulator of G-protein signaling domain-containing protein n=1 Tax=Aspergillus ambiguus TaxID=176160 RepID=UPI003CCD178C